MSLVGHVFSDALLGKPSVVMYSSGSAFCIQWVVCAPMHLENGFAGGNGLTDHVVMPVWWLMSKWYM